MSKLFRTVGFSLIILALSSIADAGNHFASCPGAERSESSSESHRDVSVDEKEGRVTKTLSPKSFRPARYSIRCSRYAFGVPTPTQKQAEAIREQSIHSPYSSISVFSSTVLRI